MEKKGQEDGRLILKPIAKIFTDFPTKFGIPRQSVLGGKLEGEIVFEPEYRNPDAVRGLEEYSHIWLIWEFSESVRSGWSATVRPPRLGGNTRVGVFATRSPFRPNPLGLSSVQLEEILYTKDRGPVLKVRGVDMMNGTPVYDIKPYSPSIDCHPEALGGLAERTRDYGLKVEIPEELLSRIAKEKREGLLTVLSQDPRPSYQKDPERIYGMEFADWEIRFQVREQVLTVCGVYPRKDGVKIKGE